MRSPRAFFRTLFLMAGIALFTGCGGGVPDSTRQNLAPIAIVTTQSTGLIVGAAVQLDGSASTDPEGSALAYRWSLTVPAGSASTLVSATTAKTSFIPDVAGTYSANLVVNDGQKDSANASMSLEVEPVVPPVIQIDKAEPLSDAVKLSLSGTVTGTVTWYVDLRLLGTGNASDAHSISWATSGVSNGSHQILARIQTGTNTYQELQKTVVVANSSIRINASVSGTTGTIYIDTRASSSFGITSVSAKFDGRQVAVLTQPNACSDLCSGANDVYRFTLNAATVGSGAHTMVITASDGEGSSKSTTLSVPINNPPVLSVSSPADGAIANGTLRVVGTASSDKPGLVTTTVAIGDVQIYSTQETSFDTTYSLSGVTPGSYVLTVSSSDSSGLVTQVTKRVAVSSSATMAFVPAFTMPERAKLLAAEGTKVLYGLTDGGVILRDIQTSALVALSSTSTLQYATDWQVSGDRVYVQARDVECTPTFTCIFEWTSSGVRRNLSAINPFAAGSSSQENPVARAGFVIWTNWNGPNAGSYTLYDATTQAFTKIAQPTSVNYLGNTDYDFGVVNGTVDFWYWGQTGGSGTDSIFDVYNWRSATGTSTRITNANARSIYPQVAQSRSAWQQFPVGGSADGTFTLVSTALNGGAPQVLGTQVTVLRAKDSVLAWSSNVAGGGRTLKALVPTGTTVLSNSGSVVLFANDSGFVIYGESGKVYSWNAATGIKKLILESVPNQVLATGGMLIFTINLAVYGIPLN